MRLFDIRMHQKQPFIGVFIKRYSENMQQIYRRTPKLQSNFIEITLRHGCSHVNLLHIFITSFSKNTSGGLLLMHLSHDKFHEGVITIFVTISLKFSMYSRVHPGILLRRSFDVNHFC